MFTPNFAELTLPLRRLLTVRVEIVYKFVEQDTLNKEKRHYCTAHFSLIHPKKPLTL